MIDKIAAKFGRKVWETPIGFKYICDKMLEGDIVVGGEESGGIGTKLYLPERDATRERAAARRGDGVARQAAGRARRDAAPRIRRTSLRPRRPDTERRAEGESDRAHFRDAKLQKLLDWPIVRREDLDGVKVYLGEIGWVMVRASGTERILRVYSETTRPETTRRVLAEVAALVQKL